MDASADGAGASVASTDSMASAVAASADESAARLVGGRDLLGDVHRLLGRHGHGVPGDRVGEHRVGLDRFRFDRGLDRVGSTGSAATGSAWTASARTVVGRLVGRLVQRLVDRLVDLLLVVLLRHDYSVISLLRKNLLARAGGRRPSWPACTNRRS